MTTTTDPAAILRLFRVPDPNVGTTIEFLLTLPELAGVSYELRNSSDGELEVAVHGASPVARDDNRSCVPQASRLPAVFDRRSDRR